MTVVWWAQGADRERALTALPAGNRREQILRFDFAAGGERDRPGLRRSSDVAVVEAADVGQGNHAAELGWLDGARLGCILLERDASASRGSSEGNCANGDGDVPRSGRSRGREAHGGGCR